MPNNLKHYLTQTQKNKGSIILKHIPIPIKKIILIKKRDMKKSLKHQVSQETAVYKIIKEWDLLKKGDKDE